MGKAEDLKQVREIAKLVDEQPGVILNSAIRLENKINNYIKNANWAKIYNYPFDLTCKLKGSVNSVKLNNDEFYGNNSVQGNTIRAFDAGSNSLCTTINHLTTCINLNTYKSTTATTATNTGYLPDLTAAAYTGRLLFDVAATASKKMTVPVHDIIININLAAIGAIFVVRVEIANSDGTFNSDWAKIGSDAVEAALSGSALGTDNFENLVGSGGYGPLTADPANNVNFLLTAESITNDKTITFDAALSRAVTVNAMFIAAVTTR